MADSRFLSGAVLGGLLGAGVALLYSPQPVKRPVGVLPPGAMPIASMRHRVACQGRLSISSATWWRPRSSEWRWLRTLPSRLRTKRRRASRRVGSAEARRVDGLGRRLRAHLPTSTDAQQASVLSFNEHICLYRRLIAGLAPEKARRAPSGRIGRRSDAIKLLQPR